MPQYLAPGVYVEEVPSAVKAIAGVGTSTPGFIGVVPDQISLPAVVNEAIGTGNGSDTVFQLTRHPIDTASLKVRVGGTETTATAAEATDDIGNKIYRITITPAPTANAEIRVDYSPLFRPDKQVGEVKLCTNFSEFKKSFGDFSSIEDHNYLVHAVYGFFNNGGSSCYVTRIKDFATDAEVNVALDALARIDDIALIAAPGQTDDTIRNKLIIHCRTTGDRFAILDGPETATDLTRLTRIAAEGGVMPQRTDLAAWYFPWLVVKDPLTNQPLAVPPSGHIAGIYARVDNERGVHKAPANEAILGISGVSQALSKAEQDKLNPKGVNCIRVLNNNILVWGARTIGGDDNSDLKYINVRRTLLFLRESIDEGTQWVVFEPNTPDLWKRIDRNISAFLTNVWRSGALFGATPEQAFYVKCDAETNPPEERELGRVITEIGVAIVRPAEFVIFRISQMAAPS
jgi:uncharacterized protein